ncbi:MAG: replication-associated recombination protein A [Bacteroidales bacterium]|nr:replication-associated recombination protein A [Bacteroidales bacterium]
MPPLPERMRPHTLSEYVGQRHLVGEGCILRNMIESGNLSSFILWGPPGVGKTTLARIIADSLDREFFTLSAVSAGVKDVRDVIDSAKSRSLFSHAAAPVLFIDEIHRFNKAQQDALLGAVEAGTIVLIGATTENPSFEVITPLLSRCQVFVLKSLEAADLMVLLERAIREDPVLKERNVTLSETEALLRQSGGDARKLLNILEIVVDASAGRDRIVIDNQLVTNCLQENIAIYDKDGEMHYDIISAFIKSIRGSDPNAAIYYLARMLDGGEDPLFIARRLCLSASEDVGLANPNALLLANACFQTVNVIGMPEARIPLAECTVYLASSPKSNASYMALEEAMQVAREDKTRSVPLYLRNAPTQLMEELGYADGYKYAHDFPGHFVDQEFMPAGLEGRVFYHPQPNRHEDVLKAYLEACWPKYYPKK